MSERTLKVRHLNAYLIPSASDLSTKTRRTVEYIESNSDADVICLNEVFDFPVGMTGRVLMHSLPLVLIGPLRLACP